MSGLKELLHYEKNQAYPSRNLTLNASLFQNLMTFLFCHIFNITFSHASVVSPLCLVFQGFSRSFFFFALASEIQFIRKHADGSGVKRLTVISIISITAVF